MGHAPSAKDYHVATDLLAEAPSDYGVDASAALAKARNDER